MRALRKMREQCGFGQSQLAEMMGVAQTTISKWELGDTTPRPKTLTKLANMLGVKKDELLADEDRKTTASEKPENTQTEEKQKRPASEPGETKKPVRKTKTQPKQSTKTRTVKRASSAKKSEVTSEPEPKAKTRTVKRASSAKKSEVTSEPETKAKTRTVKRAGSAKKSEAASEPEPRVQPDLEPKPEHQRSTKPAGAVKELQTEQAEPELAIALHLADSYDGISEVGKAELYKYIQYLRYMYPAETNKGVDE